MQKERLDLLAKINPSCSRIQKPSGSYPPVSEYLGPVVQGQRLPRQIAGESMETLMRDKTGNDKVISNVIID